MGKYVGNIPELSFLYILFDRIQWFLCCNLGNEALMKVYAEVCIHVWVCVLPLLKYTLFHLCHQHLTPPILATAMRAIEITIALGYCYANSEKD